MVRLPRFRLSCITITEVVGSRTVRVPVAPETLVGAMPVLLNTEVLSTSDGMASLTAAVAVALLPMTCAVMALPPPAEVLPMVSVASL